MLQYRFLSQLRKSLFHNDFDSEDFDKKSLKAVNDFSFRHFSTLTY